MKWGRYDRFNTDTAIERFLSKVDKTDSCWLWKGAIASHGRYGSVGIAGKSWLAHRAAWFLFMGADPGTSCVCHHCDNGMCVNPSHLFLGTQTDNIHDMENKKRAKHPKLEAHGRAKLTMIDVLQIRQFHAEGMATRTIARRFPEVCRTTVRSIVKGKTWVHQVISGSPNNPK